MVAPLINAGKREWMQTNRHGAARGAHQGAENAFICLGRVGQAVFACRPPFQAAKAALPPWGDEVAFRRRNRLRHLGTAFASKML